MNARAASLHGRIVRAFVVIVILAVALGVGVGYYATRSQVDGFVEQLTAVEADSVARSLSRAYRSSRGWAGVERVLADAGFREGGEEGGHDRRGGHEERGSETFHVERVRVVVVDGSGVVIHDNLSRLAPGAPAPDLGGEPATVTDGAAGLPVGAVHVDVDSAFLATESHGLLRRVLTTTVLGGVLIAAVALALAAWLSRRITAPVTRLTEAARSVARQGASSLLPVTSGDELGQMSTAFNRMTTALETQRNLRRRLVDDVSHELNTPLSVIQLEAKGLRDGLQKPEQGADRIIREVTMLRNVVRDLDWLADSDSGEVRLVRRPVPVAELIAAEVRRWQPQARMRGVALAFRQRTALPELDLDRTRMSQALGIVVHNALQHTDAGGAIEVAAGVQPAGDTMITVSDDGAGIDPTDLPHLFERLYRADRSRSRDTGGSGLGLAIARAILTAHSGTIDVASGGLGQGTTVRVSLPGAA
ncbi:MAG: HAMP domain-containing sensor histidine kinase [Spirochaetaceae bacterium]|nr:HAMP domain-containing sensor histidine kinase [Spirochaetaceae bacterium]